MTEGVLLVDKPAGVTSHDVVAEIRRSLPRKTKVGHSGTLDPFATGLLIILIGPATRTQQLFMDLGKTYEVSARFGAVSATGDIEGEITETGAIPAGEIELPTGEINQRPPIYSAVHIDGERAHERARRGEVFEMPQRTVTVTRFEQTGLRGRDRDFLIECSSGTYVRSLISDLGDAYCTALRRTSIGPFSVDDAGSQLSLHDALEEILPSVEVDHSGAQAIAHGQSIELSLTQTTSITHDGEVIALARPGEENQARPFVVFQR